MNLSVRCTRRASRLPIRTLWQALIIVAAVITIAVLSFFGLYVTALAGVKVPSLTSGFCWRHRERRAHLRQLATSRSPARWQEGSAPQERLSQT